jgi:glycerol-3-phosphate acyltransferase PlsY
MYRTFGKMPAAWTFVGDMMKAAIAVSVAMVVAGEIAAYIAMLAVVLGHAYPLYYNFKGGKGVVCAAAAILCLEPLSFGLLFMIFVAMVLGTKYISVGSIAVAVIYPIIHHLMYPITAPIHVRYSYFFGMSRIGLLFMIAFITGGFVLYFHRSNIRRILDGEESKIVIKLKHKEELE